MSLKKLDGNGNFIGNIGQQQWRQQQHKNGGNNNGTTKTAAAVALATATRMVTVANHNKEEEEEVEEEIFYSYVYLVHNRIFFKLTQKNHYKRFSLSHPDTLAVSYPPVYTVVKSESDSSH